MAEEEEKSQKNEKLPSIHGNSPLTLEADKSKEINKYSKEKNKTISVGNQNTKKKKKPPQLKLESRNTTNDFQKKNKSVSKTENY